MQHVKFVMEIDNKHTNKNSEGIVVYK